jgi:hypothetical protein
VVFAEYEASAKHRTSDGDVVAREPKGDVHRQIDAERDLLRQRLAHGTLDVSYQELKNAVSELAAAIVDEIVILTTELGGEGKPRFRCRAGRQFPEILDADTMGDRA